MRGQYWLARCKDPNAGVRPWLAPQNGTGGPRETKKHKQKQQNSTFYSTEIATT